MFLRDNKKPIKIIGYPQASLTKDRIHEFEGKTLNELSIITPEEFFNLKNFADYQYHVAFIVDFELRKKVCNTIDELNLNCISYIHDKALIRLSDMDEIGKNVAIGPFSTIDKNCVVGDHTIIDSYCLLSHNVEVGKNCLLFSGTMIMGSSKVGNNCIFGMKSSVLNRISITDNVKLTAFANVTKDIEKSGDYGGYVARKMISTGDVNKPV